MDESRAQAYLDLIQQLLDCPNKKKVNQILQANSEFLDGEFLKTCEQLATMLAAQGQENQAGFLRNLASQLGEFLGMRESDNSDAGAPADRLKFLMQLLVSVAKSEGNPQQLHPFLEQNLVQLDLQLAEILTAWATDTFGKAEAKEVNAIALVIGNLGNLIQQFPLGSRWVNLEIAIACYEIVAAVFNRSSFPEKWAMMQNNLAVAYSNRIRGELADNLEEAIVCFQSALEVYTREAFPENWAMTQNNLGNAYSDRILGDRGENLERAIAAYELALQVRTREALPNFGATTQNNLGNAYRDRILGDRGENLERAIAAYNLALQVYTREAFPENWAMTQNNLGNAYRDRILGDRGENLERAIAAYNLALQVRTREALPNFGATTQNNLGNAYRDRILGDRGENLERAIAAYNLALQVYTPEALPQNWAMTQNNLGNAYSDRILGDRGENLERAIAAYNLALQVRTREALPNFGAGTQNNLGLAYSNRILGDRGENLERAIAAYNLALQVYTREAFPQDWAMTQNNLGLAYSNRILGDRGENLERAIAAYNLALQVYTREAFPQDWAMTQNNLGLAYSDRILGDRGENLERAIAAYNLALQVRTRSAFPQDWAGTQNNLGLAYSNRILGDRGENLERAIAAYNLALQVRTRSAFPQDWAMTQNNLGNAYSNRILGDRGENLERAIAAYNLALQVYTPEALPQNWAMTQNNLGNAYRDRILGDRGENLERAIAAYNLALQVYTPEALPQNWAMTQNNLGIAYFYRILGDRGENLERAIECYQAALTVRTRSAFPQDHTVILFNLGNLYRKNQQWQLAYDTYTPAIETVEFLRGEIHSGDENKQKLAEEWNKLYLNIVEVCIALKRYTEAVEFAERSKGQNLIELLSVKDLYPQGEIPSEVRQELQQLRQRIAEENRRLQQAPEKNYDTINQMRQDFAAKSPYIPLNFAQIQQLTDDKTAIVEWYILVDSFCAFIITSANSQPQFLPFPESDLDRLIDWTNEYLGDYYSDSQNWRDSLETKLANLAQILHIDEIVQAIPNTCDKLILIPHRYLHLFPLHALPTNSKYLIDAFPRGVSYAPSCQILHQVQKYQRGKFERLFAIQNPTDDLMAADMEIETIKNVFPHPEILVKENAKKGKTGEEPNEKLAIAAQVANSHHLFFSCHGSFNLEDPLQSGLQLADDVLTLEEIFRHFNLSQCSLVTLSACETGQVQLDNTDEYISLTSGFLLAGSPSLYVTLWSVNAFSTAILLIKTYENLYHQPGKFALALNQAQIWVRDTDIQGFLDWTNQCHLLDDDWRGSLQCFFEEDKATHGVNARIYQNPYHWAGFCAAGKGEQNMANSITKLAVFQQLIQESDLFVNLRDALVSLKDKLTDNDEENIKIVEEWLEDKPAIKQKYKAKLMRSGDDKLGRDGKSSTKRGQKTPLLKEMIENLVAAEKTPKQDP